MKLRTPEISWFARKSILSLDFHHLDDNYNCDDAKNTTNLPPKFTKGYRRMATSALPDEEHYVRLWKIGIIENITSTTDNNVSSTKIDVSFICGLGYHETVVNVVKFSPCGPYLAAGDSDGMVVVWKFEKLISAADAPDIFEVPINSEDGEEVPSEKWKPWRRFRDHLPKKDVLDVAWSPDGTKLLSCAIDHSLIIWDVEKGTRLMMVNEHESRHPMGVAWDPRMEFFISLSNSRSMCIYEAGNNYRKLRNVTRAPVRSFLDPEKEVVSKLFHDDTLFTFSRRPCLSPCGELLFAPAGVLEEGAKTTNATFIFTRHQLAKPAVALTSSKEIPFAVSCCPVVFELRPAAGSPAIARFDLPYRIIFAVLTKSSVIFYDTQTCEPFAYVSNFQYGRALDMVWTDDGRCLVVCAEEGYCTFISFDQDELGLPIKEIPRPTPTPQPEPEPESEQLTQQPEPEPQQQVSSPTPLSTSVSQSPNTTTNTISKWLTPLK